MKERKKVNSLTEEVRDAAQYCLFNLLNNTGRASFANITKRIVIFVFVHVPKQHK